MKDGTGDIPEIICFLIGHQPTTATKVRNVVGTTHSHREDVGCEFNDPSVQSRDTLRDVRSWWVLFTIDLHKVWTNMKVAFKV